MLRRIAVFSLLLLAACQDRPPTAPSVPAPTASVNAAGVIPGHFIVTLRAGEDPGVVARAHGVAPRYLYRTALIGFAGAISDAARAGLLRDARVVHVEPDQVMTAWGSQSGATWGLDRIDQKGLPLNGTYTYNYTGAGVTAYIIDTGILISHSEFGGRASVGVDEVGGGQNGIDCNGHGTHVAGTVGGTTYGVAKGVTLVAVRVLDCSGSGTTSGVVAGIDWVTANHMAGAPAVANMSLGGGASTTLDNAVRNSIADGVAYAVAAGNGNWLGIAANACNYSPARVAEAMTIGATDATDTKASWSNYGSCVDWFAPGVSITSAWYTSNTATNTISGTSMATPHTTGVAALVLQEASSLTPAQVRDRIFATLSTGMVKNSNTTNNHLLYSLMGAAPPPNTPPTAAFTYSCTGLTCTFTDGSSDADGTIASWSWSFGDGATSSARSPSHTYAAAGTYTVTEMVTDNGGATAMTSHGVTVTASTAAAPTGLSGTATAKGTTKVNLTWSGGAATVNVWREGVVIATPTNTGVYSDNLGKRPTGSRTYKICNAGSATECSNEWTWFAP